MQVFFTNLGLLEGEGSYAASDLEPRGLADGMPFVLDRDGSYDTHLNRFFRALPTMGVPAPNSWQAYAQDIILWIRFLRIRQKTIWMADNSDLAAFWVHRRQWGRGIEKSTWSRWVSATDKFYRWARQEGLIYRVPFTYKDASRLALTTGETESYQQNQAHERGSKRVLVKYISLEQYLFFRDVGLRGRLPDGRQDRGFRGRNGTRNATFAELLVNVGLRNSEGNSLLLGELPDPGDREDRAVPFQLPGSITKGGVVREVFVPTRVLRLIRDYIENERDNSVARALRQSGTGRYEGVERPMLVRPVGSTRAYQRLGDRQSMAFSRTGPALRRRLIRCDEGEGAQPCMIWLTEQGLPMRSANWGRIFKAATHRCRTFPEWDTLVDVTPHTLRHTFAINMLTELTRAFYGGFAPEELRSDLIRVTRMVAGNPLLRLQKLLGHKYIATTMIYLEYMDEAREIVEAASLEWGTRTGITW